MRILLLGGTAGAGRLARVLAQADIDTVYSYAGRTDMPAPQPVPTRIGGFGGVAGLVSFIEGERITHVIDATHPFAVQISHNAVAACAETGTWLIAYERAPWTAQPGDDWHMVPDIPAAVAALPQAPARVFLAIGRQHLSPFAERPQHHYLLRLVDPPTAPLPLPLADMVIARGPFSQPDDLALLKKHRIGWIVARNAGGHAARAKLDAARSLGLPVILIERPALPPRINAFSPDEVIHWLAHPTRLGV